MLFGFSAGILGLMVSPEAKVTLILLCFLLSSVELTGASLLGVGKLSEAEGCTLAVGIVLFGFSTGVSGLTFGLEDCSLLRGEPLTLVGIVLFTC